MSKFRFYFECRGSRRRKNTLSQNGSIHSAYTQLDAPRVKRRMKELLQLSSDGLRSRLNVLYYTDMFNI